MTPTVLNGVETIEFAKIKDDGTVDESTWQRLENIEDGSVSVTSNADNTTPITPEDKKKPILILFNPAAADAFNFALLEFTADNLKVLFNVEYDASVSLTTVLSDKKHANLAIRLTTIPQFGKKLQLTYRNTLCDPTFKNNITKGGLVAIAVAASILDWKTTSGKDASFTIQVLDEDGNPINGSGTPGTFDTIQSFNAQASVTTAAVTTTLNQTDAEAKFAFNKILNTTGAPNTMNYKKGGNTIAVVDFPGDYLNKDCLFTDLDGTQHTGKFTNGDVAV